ncbi:methyltransferase family protein [Haloglomus irregulare]|nr:isoprenylcysteine carboxylmethyltransferase family protein [Haloglomus irregulare]
MTDHRAYPFGLAPAVVVLAVGPALAVGFPSPVGVDPGPGRYLGIPVVVAGLAFAGWAVHTFAVAEEPPSHTREPGTLVTDGPLRYSRNPIYLGTVAAALGEALLSGSVLLAGYGLALWAVYHVVVVRREEPHLRAALGEAYADYCERVPRWL